MTKKGRVAATLWILLGLATAASALLAGASGPALVALLAGLLVAAASVPALLRGDRTRALSIASAVAALGGAAIVAAAFLDRFPGSARFRVAACGFLMLCVAAYEAATWRDVGREGMRA